MERQRGRGSRVSLAGAPARLPPPSLLVWRTVWGSWGPFSGPEHWSQSQRSWEPEISLLGFLIPIIIIIIEMVIIATIISSSTA